MAVEGDTQLLNVVVLLGAAVVAVPLFKRLGLGSVLGYLAAGLAIGPFGLGLFSNPQTILHTAELGVVMYLFVIGLEMRPTHLWDLRGEIFGLGSAQIGLCGLMLTGVGLAYGFPLGVSFISAMGFVLTSTAIVMQLLSERGDVNLPRGQKIVSVLLFEDMLIVPLLAIVAFMSPTGAEPVPVSQRLQAVGIGLGSLALLVMAGIWLLNPMFRILAKARAREVMTAAALLVVLGAALLMQLGGLSMAMGAFLAGVLLSESSFRHQLEADVEPFRGILLGLFFLAVGMSLDLAVVWGSWPLIVSAVLAMMGVKALCIYVAARFMKSAHSEAVDRAVLMAQGGEFAFVLFAAAAAAGVIDLRVNANMTAIVVLSMALTPVFVILLRRFAPKAAQSMEGVEEARDLKGNVLLIGFGRFGQVVSQPLLARGFDVTIIETNAEDIRNAADFGFKVHYGDGTRMDVLHAAGGATACAILVCVDSRASANRIVELARETFPQASLLVRAFDREHAFELARANVDFHIREVFESAVAFGAAALRELEVPADEAEEIIADVRRRDTERFALELAGGLFAGRALIYGNAVPRGLAPAKPAAELATAVDVPADPSRD